MDSPQIRKSLGLWSCFIFTFLLLLFLRSTSLDSSYFDLTKYTDLSLEYEVLRSAAIDLYSVHKDLYSLSCSYSLPANLTSSESLFTLRSAITEGWLEIIKLIINF